MKKLKLLILTMFLIAGCKAQQQYFQVPELQKFVGTWIYEANGDKFVLKLESMVRELGGIRSDEIIGRYTFYKNNHVFVNTFDSLKAPITLGILGYVDLKKMKDRIQFQFHDVKKNRFFDGFMVMVEDSDDEAVFTLRNREGIRVITSPEEAQQDRSPSINTPIKLKKNRIG